MITKYNDTGVISTLLNHFNQHSFPRLVDIKESVENGTTLNDLDMAFVGSVMRDCEKAKFLVKQHPELEGVFSKVTSLLHSITLQAQTNEQLVH